MQDEGRITTRNWDRYDTRHVVYRPAQLKPDVLKDGYDWAYREFYRLAVDRPGVAVSRLAQAPGEAFLLCDRMEEIRAAVELGDPGAAVVADAPYSRRCCPRS
jgi:hypothetical protein